MKKDSVKKIVETSVFVGLAVVIDLLFKLIPFLKMPEGGHVSVAMLAIIVNGFRNGWKYGLSGGFVFAVINFMFDGYVFHWGSIFFDYIFAFTALGISGFFKESGRKLYKFNLIIVLCCFMRYIFSSFSGVIFFKEYARIPEYLDWNISGEALYWVYSFIIYNLPYMGLSCILCVIIGSILHYRNLIYKNME